MLACASFFAGVGGIDFGFEQAGFDVVYANEFCEKASITFKQNHGVELDTRDIRDVPSTEIPDFDVMLAGFPCQAFSVAGYRQGFEDEKGRGNLYFELERIMKDKRPSIVFLENVKNLVGHDRGRTFRIIRSSMEDMGYKIHHKVMNACDYGDIPQNRERIYVVGFLDDGMSDCFRFPDEIPLETTIGDVFDFEGRVDDRYYYGEDTYMYKDLKREMTSSETVYQWRRKYVRENKSSLCPTLTANMGTGGHNVPLIKTKHGFRKLTPKECFMIQGFDRKFVLPENVANSHLYKQAGNSVVVPVIRRIANSIMYAVNMGRRKMILDNKENLYRFNEKDIENVLYFVKEYHLNPTKGSRGRTNQGKRGFGGELDEWVPGKLLEIAVCKILEKYSSGKELSPDFEIYSDHEVGKKSDPDITSVLDPDGSDRPPNVFVEIKRLDSKSRWMGPRQHQLKDMDEGYMVHASIEFDDDLSTKQRDITAAVLKYLMKEEKIDLSEFSDLNNLVAKIEYVYSFKELKEKGHFFESGNIIPETDFPTAKPAYKKDGTLSIVYEIKEEIKGSSEVKMKWEGREEYTDFSDWVITGNCQILKDKRGKEFIYAIENTTMFSKIFGSFEVKAGQTNRFYFTNTLGKSGGKDVFKSIDDFWFSRRRLDELLLKNEIADPISMIKRIAHDI